MPNAATAAADNPITNVRALAYVLGRLDPAMPGSALRPGETFAAYRARHEVLGETVDDLLREFETVRAATTGGAGGDEPPTATPWVTAAVTGTAPAAVTRINSHTAAGAYDSHPHTTAS